MSPVVYHHQHHDEGRPVCLHLPLPRAEPLLPGPPPELRRPGAGGDPRSGGRPLVSPVRPGRRRC